MMNKLKKVIKYKVNQKIFKIINNLPRSIRMFFYNIIGICGKHEVIQKGIYCDKPSNIKIGDYGFINFGCQFYIGYEDDTKIIVGNRVWIAPNCHFYCVSHEVASSYQRAGNNCYDNIIINDGVWIGGDTTVLSGVEIGEGSVVAAKSLVNKSIPPNEMWGGVPAKFIKKLDI